MGMYIITHKQFENRIQTEGYKTIQVGAYKGHISADFYDDIGDNISKKNPNYCELTGIYWLWKNSQDPYIGISHYRRFFTHSFNAKKALTSNEIDKLLSKYEVILPFHAKYKKSIADDYCEISGKMEDLEKVGVILERMWPDYAEDYKSFLAGNRCTLYNMMIINKEKYDEYCSWLFGILFELEKSVDLNQYNDYQKRIYGFLAERLLNVWIIHNKLKACEVGVIPTEEKRSLLVRILTGCKRTLLYKIL